MGLNEGKSNQSIKEGRKRKKRRSFGKKGGEHNGLRRAYLTFRLWDWIEQEKKKKKKKKRKRKKGKGRNVCKKAIFLSGIFKPNQKLMLDAHEARSDTDHQRGGCFSLLLLLSYDIFTKKREKLPAVERTKRRIDPARMQWMGGWLHRSLTSFLRKPRGTTTKKKKRKKKKSTSRVMSALGTILCMVGSMRCLALDNLPISLERGMKMQKKSNVLVYYTSSGWGKGGGIRATCAIWKMGMYCAGTGNSLNGDINSQKGSEMTRESIAKKTRAVEDGGGSPPSARARVSSLLWAKKVRACMIYIFRCSAVILRCTVEMTAREIQIMYQSLQHHLPLSRTCHRASRRHEAFLPPLFPIFPPPLPAIRNGRFPSSRLDHIHTAEIVQKLDPCTVLDSDWACRRPRARKKKEKKPSLHWHCMSSHASLGSVSIT